MKYLSFLLIVLGLNVNAQVINIPDVVFKERLLSASPGYRIARNINGAYVGIDINNDKEIQASEAAQIGFLEITGGLNNIQSLEGIEGFFNLEYLSCDNNAISNLDLTGLSHLKYVSCEFNGMKSINLTGLTSLETLDCSTNWFPSLEITNLPRLKTVNCSNNSELKKLVVSDLPLLDSLNCNNTFYVDSVIIKNVPVLRYINFSTSNFKAGTIKDLISLEEIVAGNGFNYRVSELDLNKLVNLKTINVQHNSLQNIIFPKSNAIKKLIIAQNQFTGFNKNILPNLKYLDISWNGLHSLDVSNMAYLEMLFCSVNGNVFDNYKLTELNVQGCHHLKKLNCEFNDIKVLDLSNLFALETVVCRQNVDNSNADGLKVIDLQNCTSLMDLDCSMNPFIEELDLSCSMNYTRLDFSSCAKLRFVNLKNGKMDNIYLFAYFNPELKLVCVDYNENFAVLPPEVAQSPYYNFTPECRYNTVTGNVRFDLEGNGCVDNKGINGTKIEYSSASSYGYTYTNSNGDFIIYTKADSIALIPHNELFNLWDFALDGPLAVEFSPGIDSLHVDFCLAPKGEYKDLEVVFIPLERAFPGFDTDYKLVYKNKGNKVLSGDLFLHFQDSIMDLVSAVPPPDIQTQDSLRWNYTDLMPFESRTVYFTMNLNKPTETPPLNGNDTLIYAVLLSPFEEDQTPVDNGFTLNQIVVNSFDPNDKTCLEGSWILPEKVGDYLHYLIRFENTGTAEAVNVVVRDVINTSQFDITTLMPIDASHPVYTRITEGNLAEFIFENINLPFDDDHNDGYIAFKIKTLPTHMLFYNQAQKFSHYNFPFLTNMAITEVSRITGISDIEKYSPVISVYPNPVNDILNISTLDRIEKMEIYDLSGRKVKSIFTTDNRINIESLVKGMYLLKVYTNTTSGQAVIIKE